MIQIIAKSRHHIDLQGVSKKCPNYKIASELDICKITDNQQQPMANIGGHQVCIVVNFVFICSILLAGGDFKMLNFQVACAPKFRTKINFCGAVSKYGMLL